LRRYFAGRRNQLQRALTGPLLREKNRLAYLARSASAQILLRRMREWAQRIDMAGERLQRKVREEHLATARRLAELSSRLRQHLPDPRLSLYRYPLEAMVARLSTGVRAQWLERKQRFLRAEGLLKALSPQATLARGFSVTTTSDGKIIRSIKDAGSQARIVTKLRDGSLKSVVE